MDDARKTGQIVNSHIRFLLDELHTLRRQPEALAGTSAQSGQTTSSEEAEGESVDKSKGMLMVTWKFSNSQLGNHSIRFFI